MSKRTQPAALARAREARRAEREQRTPELLQLRSVLALERIAASLESLRELAVFVPYPNGGKHGA